MIPDYRILLTALKEAEVEFAIVGGIALVLRGSSRVTLDLDVAYARDRENLKRLAKALKPFSPALRGAPPGLPFVLDAPTLQSGLNFTLTSTVGDIDLLGEIAGLGAFSVVARFARPMEVYGLSMNVLSLDGLERAKRAAGRLKDLADLEEILALRKRARD